MWENQQLSVKIAQNLGRKISENGEREFEGLTGIPVCSKVRTETKRNISERKRTRKGEDEV